MRPAVYIADANIIIDLIDLGLGWEWTDHYRCLTTQEVINEVEHDCENDAANWLSDSSRLEIRTLTSFEAEKVGKLHTRHAGLSYPDCTVVWLAQMSSLTVLSGDGPMRKKAPSLKIKVHGMLYVLEQLVALEAIGPSKAIELCQQWQQLNPRTPERKCAEYCNRWRSY